MEVRNQSNANFLLNPPYMKSNPKRRELGKYCDINQDFKHNTNEYKELKDALEDTMRRGYWRYFVVNPQDRL